MLNYIISGNPYIWGIIFCVPIVIALLVLVLSNEDSKVNVFYGVIIIGFLTFLHINLLFFYSNSINANSYLALNSFIIVLLLNVVKLIKTYLAIYNNKFSLHLILLIIFLSLVSSYILMGIVVLYPNMFVLFKLNKLVSIVSLMSVVYILCNKTPTYTTRFLLTILLLIISILTIDSNYLYEWLGYIYMGLLSVIFENNKIHLASFEEGENVDIDTKIFKEIFYEKYKNEIKYLEDKFIAMWDYDIKGLIQKLSEEDLDNSLNSIYKRLELTRDIESKFVIRYRIPSYDISEQQAKYFIYQLSKIYDDIANDLKRLSVSIGTEIYYPSREGKREALLYLSSRIELKSQYIKDLITLNDKLQVCEKFNDNKLKKYSSFLLDNNKLNLIDPQILAKWVQTEFVPEDELNFLMMRLKERFICISETILCLEKSKYLGLITWEDYVTHSNMLDLSIKSLQAEIYKLSNHVSLSSLSNVYHYEEFETLYKEIHFKSTKLANLLNTEKQKSPEIWHDYQHIPSRESFMFEVGYANIVYQKGISYFNLHNSFLSRPNLENNILEMYIESNSSIYDAKSLAKAVINRDIHLLKIKLFYKTIDENKQKFSSFIEPEDSLKKVKYITRYISNLNTRINILNNSKLLLQELGVNKHISLSVYIKEIEKLKDEYSLVLNEFNIINKKLDIKDEFSETKRGIIIKTSELTAFHLQSKISELNSVIQITKGSTFTTQENSYSNVLESGCKKLELQYESITKSSSSVPVYYENIYQNIARRYDFLLEFCFKLRDVRKLNLINSSAFEYYEKLFSLHLNSLQNDLKRHSRYYTFKELSKQSKWYEEKYKDTFEWNKELKILQSDILREMIDKDMLQSAFTSPVRKVKSFDIPKREWENKDK